MQFNGRKQCKEHSKNDLPFLNYTHIMQIMHNVCFKRMTRHLLLLDKQLMQNKKAYTLWLDTEHSEFIHSF